MLKRLDQWLQRGNLFFQPFSPLYSILLRCLRCPQIGLLPRNPLLHARECRFTSAVRVALGSFQLRLSLLDSFPSRIILRATEHQATVASCVEWSTGRNEGWCCNLKITCSVELTGDSDLSWRQNARYCVEWSTGRNEDWCCKLKK